MAAVGCYANLVQPHDPRLHSVTLRDLAVALSALSSQSEFRSRQVVVWSGTYGRTGVVSAAALAGLPAQQVEKERHTDERGDHPEVDLRRGVQRAPG